MNEDEITEIRDLTEDESAAVAGSLWFLPPLLPAGATFLLAAIPASVARLLRGNRSGPGWIASFRPADAGRPRRTRR